MGPGEIKKELKALNKEELINLMADLYKKNKSVKEFFDFYFHPNEKELFHKYQDKVFQSFYPKRGFDLKLKQGKQAIVEFKKFGPASELVCELMLFYVETGVKFTNDFGDVDEGFYASLAKTYQSALLLMQSEDLLHRFKERAFKVVADTKGTGWGFHDYLQSAYGHFYVDDFEETEQVEERSSLAPVVRLSTNG